MNRVLIALCILGLVLGNANPAVGAVPRVVASTSWTAAFVRGAGVERMEILAPVDLQDPSAYQLKAGDLAKIKKATWVIYAGDEGFTDQLVQAAGASANLLRIHTQNTPDNIRRETERISKALGTEATQSAWMKQFEGIASRIKADINATFPEGTKAIVHRSQVAFVRWLGFAIVGEMESPALSAQEVDALAAQKPEIVIDSYHNPVGPLVAEKAAALYVEFISYPGKDDTRTLEDVLRYNRDQIVSYPLSKSEPASAEKAIPLMMAIAGVLFVILLASAILLWRLQRS